MINIVGLNVFDATERVRRIAVSIVRTNNEQTKMQSLNSGSNFARNLPVRLPFPRVGQMSIAMEAY